MALQAVRRPHQAAPQWAAGLAFDPMLAAQAQALGSSAAMVASQGPRQSSLALGARWDFHPPMSLKRQWDPIRTQAMESTLWTSATPDPARSQVATVLLDFVF